MISYLFLIHFQLGSQDNVFNHFQLEWLKKKRNNKILNKNKSIFFLIIVLLKVQFAK